MDIAVIRLPRISNFTDFSVFGMIPQVRLRYVRNLRELGNPDMVILPGTKSTMEDLLWLRREGLEAESLELEGKEGSRAGGRGGGLQGQCPGIHLSNSTELRHSSSATTAAPPPPAGLTWRQLLL